MTHAIETNGLSKSFGTVLAVDSVNLRIGQGEIYAFLGLNGAGKTTTIRLLLGMIKPSEGSVKVLCEAVGPNGCGPWRQVGHLVESPAAYPELSVKENLEISRRLQGISEKNATTCVIERLGLEAYADRKAWVLSAGNLQRLGLARAMLHEPALLILDEPAKGLDPAGVVEIRELLANLAREKGVTVFMSSHILTEVDRLATRIGVIHRGRLIEELDAEKLEEMRKQRLEIEVRDFEAAQRVLSKAGIELNASGSTIFMSESRAIQAPDTVATLLVEAGTPPTRLAVVQEDLEDHFLRLTGERE